MKTKKTREKSKMNFEDILKKPHYGEILRLLMDFGDKEDGLKQLHFRYALIKKHGLCADSVRKMEEFFGDELDAFQLSRPSYIDVVESPYHFDHITSKQKLTNYLTTLVNRGILKKHGKRPHVKYELTPYFFREFIRWFAKGNINWWGNEFVYPVAMTEEFIIDSYSGSEDLFLFGISEKITKLLSKHEREMIKWLISEMLYCARKILAIKYSKTEIKMSSEEWEKNKSKSSKVEIDYLKREKELANLSFFYNGHIDINFD